jgi:mevalonate kinase
MEKITVSAPGKLMLLGEHAVVYNHPCLVTAVDQRMRITVELLDTSEFQLEANDVEITGYKKPMRELGKGDIPKGARFTEIAVKNTLELNSIILRHSGNQAKPEHPESPMVQRDSGQARLAFALASRLASRRSGRSSGLASLAESRRAKRARMTVGVSVTTKSEFSNQFGFGSSSASTVCTVKALSELFKLNLSLEEIFDISYKTVLDIQSKGSGFDIAAAVYGRTLYFTTRGRAIESLDIEPLPLVVGYSGTKADTVMLINKVKGNFANRKNRLEEIYNGIEVLVNQAKGAIMKMDWEMLGSLMNKNQKYLKELGISIEKLDSMIKASVNAGAYGAKLSGAGGGDCMIALVDEGKREKVIGAIQSAGGEIIDIKTGAEGVRIE